MKNTRKYVLLATILAFIICNTYMGISAAEPEEPEEPTGPESNVIIEFEEGDANVGPLDPEDPEIPGNGGTDESGSLALNYVSNFTFEKQEILTFTVDYPTTTQTPYIQVTDARGTGEGWSVSARASKFRTAEGKESLFGASITFKNASCISPAPEIPPPQPKDPVTLKFNGTNLEKVVSAREDTGMGTWLTRWYTNPNDLLNYSVVLTVPSSSGMKGENSAKITWILSAGPT